MQKQKLIHLNGGYCDNSFYRNWHFEEKKKRMEGGEKKEIEIFFLFLIYIFQISEIEMLARKRKYSSIELQIFLPNSSLLL